MKSLVVLAVLIFIVVILMLCLAKHLDTESGFAINDSCKLMFSLPNLTHLSTHLNGSQYQLDMDKIGLAGLFMLLLTFWRVLLLKRMWI